jgi:hypothetical protein
MKKIYLIILLVVVVIKTNNAQNKMAEPYDPESSPIVISQDKEKKIVKVTFTSRENSTFAIKLKNEMGKVVYEDNIPEKKKKHAKEIDLNLYGLGIYFIEVDCDKIQEVERIENL